VALIAVLEAIEPGTPDVGTRRTLICVANTHIHANPELNDVKIWQVHTLLKGLEKIAARCDKARLAPGEEGMQRRQAMGVRQSSAVVRAA
jgi:CCR4-NOT transcription complex subunit 6